VHDKSLFRDTEIAGVPVRIVQPRQTQVVEKKMPLVIYIHGGGFVAGSLGNT
jgi:acetyl esterase/lipase